MASNCPNCGRKLRFYNIKAECPDCGVSIPNYNWEARLEEDNLKAEAKFNKLYATLNMLKYSVFGTKLRVIRIILSLIPAVGFILPWASVKGEGAALNFDLLGIFTEGTSTIKFFPILFGDLGGVISSMSNPAVLYIIAGFFLMLLSVITIVVAFFLPFVLFKRPKTKAAWIADLISEIFAVGGAVMFVLSSGNTAGASFAIGSLEFVNASSGVLWGSFVYILLLLVPLAVNLLVAKADIKTPEQLEAERLEKVRIKEEKEEKARLEKEKAKAEAMEKAKQEQAEKVRKAREALANKDKN